ncbi:MAG: response regulator transcription factor [Candidatus Sumerlaeia bacterium]
MTPEILLIEDDPTFYQFLKELLASDCVGLCWKSNGAEGISAALSSDYNLIILDYQLPDMLGTEILRQLKGEGVQSPIVMMTGYGSIDVAVEAMKLGAEDFFTKPMPDPAGFVRFLNRILAIDPPLALPDPAAFPPRKPEVRTEGTSKEKESLPDLIARKKNIPPIEVQGYCHKLEPPVEISKRESEVIACLLQGHSNKEIASSLFISERTVKNHLTHIYQKFGVDSRSQLFTRFLSSLA